MTLRLLLLTPLCFVAFACQSQTWEETKVHYERHDKHHDEHEEHAKDDEQGDHAAEDHSIEPDKGEKP